MATYLKNVFEKYLIELTRLYTFGINAILT